VPCILQAGPLICPFHHAHSAQPYIRHPDVTRIPQLCLRSGIAWHSVLDRELGTACDRGMTMPDSLGSACSSAVPAGTKCVALARFSAARMSRGYSACHGRVVLRMPVCWQVVGCVWWFLFVRCCCAGVLRKACCVYSQLQRGTSVCVLMAGQRSRRFGWMPVLTALACTSTLESMTAAMGWVGQPAWVTSGHIFSRKRQQRSHHRCQARHGTICERTGLCSTEVLSAGSSRTPCLYSVTVRLVTVRLVTV
jgi:hypothetical protein